MISFRGLIVAYRNARKKFSPLNQSINFNPAHPTDFCGIIEGLPLSFQ